MTLSKKMSLGVLSLLLIIFIGTFFITFNNERNYFIQQMTSNAQDTATSLGLSLSHTLKTEDKAQMLAMVQAVFDRGYFAMIEIRDLNEKLLVARYAPVRSRSAPDWFIKLIKWPDNAQTSIVMSGWKQMGHVIVISDSNYAYSALWLNALGLVYWYLILAIISLLLVYVFIKWLLKPLQRITKQARAICEGEFPIEATIPRTPELRRVTLAMNQMVTRIRDLFQDQLKQMQLLRHQSFQDPLTNLGNRRYFTQQITALLTNEEEFVPGFVLLIAIDGLKELNEQRGFQYGDQLVQGVAKTLNNFWSISENLSVARISGSNFALIVKETDSKLFIQKCNELNLNLQKIASKEPLCQIFIVATAYYLRQSVSSLLSGLDKELKAARTQEKQLSYSLDIDRKNSIEVSKEAIKKALEEKNLFLFSQAVTDGKTSFHNEIFVRMNSSLEQISAGYFMPVAQRMGIAYAIDQFVLSEIFARELLNFKTIAINLAEETVFNQNHQDAYLAKLEQFSETLRGKIYIELNEAVVLNDFSKIMLFAKQLQKLGIKMGVDQVGMQFSPMHYLDELPINYIKLHGSLIQDIEENQTRQFFIHYFFEMATTLGIQVIATQIETEQQWTVLRNLGLKWGQGNYLEPVKAI